MTVESEEAGNQRTSDETLCAIVLAGLPEKYSGIVAVTEAFGEAEYNSQRIETLIVGESRRQQHVASQAEATSKRAVASSSEAMAVDRRPRQEDDRRPRRDNRTCYNCQETGHISRWCKNLRVPRPADTAEDTSSTNRKAANVIEAELLHVRRTVATAYTCWTEGRWLVDCGATEHMCPDRN